MSDTRSLKARERLIRWQEIQEKHKRIAAEREQKEYDEFEALTGINLRIAAKDLAVKQISKSDINYSTSLPLFTPKIPAATPLEATNAEVKHDATQVTDQCKQNMIIACIEAMCTRVGM